MGRRFVGVRGGYLWGCGGGGGGGGGLWGCWGRFVGVLGEVCGAAGGDLRFVGRRFVEEVCGEVCGGQEYELVCW